MRPRQDDVTPGRLPRSLLVAAVLGGVHAGFSLYWAAGGTALTWSLGSELVAPFEDRRWWLGAVVLVGWGGLSTVVAQLVLGGLLRPSSGIDRAAMIGHAWLWDPLFLAWGLAVVVGLLVTRDRRRGQR